MPRIRSALLSFALSLLAGNGWSACVRNEHGAFEEPACASAALALAEAELDVVYKKLLQSLAPPQRAALANAQNTWLMFLSSQVSFVYAVEGDGSSGRLVATNAREESMRERAKALRNWLPQCASHVTR